MATRPKRPSPQSEYAPPPRRRDKGVPIPEEPPGIMVCIHVVLRPMTQGKKWALRQEVNREE